MLEVVNLHAGYGPIPVLADINLTVKGGEIVTVLGRNGAGKTTLMRAISGALSATSGSVRLAGDTISGLPSYSVARQGLAYVRQGRGIFAKLTVEENLLVGTRANASGNGRIPESVYEYFPILAERRSQLRGTLSGGQQQQLAIGRALCGDPRMLLLDEPSEGVQPNIVHQIGVFLRAIVAERSLSVLLVEQNLELGLKTAHRCIVIEKGRVVHEAPPTEFENEEVLRRFLAI
jgi:urea ABC transporter ATP-binding protein UrtE